MECQVPRCVDVVAGDHPDGDAGPLALLDGVGHLLSHGVLEQESWNFDFGFSQHSRPINQQFPLFSDLIYICLIFNKESWFPIVINRNDKSHIPMGIKKIRHQSKNQNKTVVLNTTSLNTPAIHRTRNLTCAESAKNDKLFFLAWIASRGNTQVPCCVSIYTRVATLLVTEKCQTLF